MTGLVDGWCELGQKKKGKQECKEEEEVDTPQG